MSANARSHLRRSRSLTVLALVALLATTAGCGARWTDEQRAGLAARAGGGAGTSEVTGSDAAAGEAGPATTQASTASTRAGGSSAGSPGQGQAAAASPGAAGADAKPCAAPSNAPGVTDDRITVGAISTLSGPVPGLGESSAAAARAYVAFRNATGGVCGREVVLKEADDGADNGRYRSIVSELGKQVLGIAGGFAFGDVGGADVLEQMKLPVVNVPAAQRTAEVSTVFDINPSYDDLDKVIGKYRFLREQGAEKVSMTYLAVDQSRAEARIQRSLMEAAGLQIVQVQELPLSTLSYDSAARGVANSGADYLFFIGDLQGNASMAQSMADTGYDLQFAEYFVFSYGTNFVELAGEDAAEGAMSWIRTLPNEEAGGNEAMASFVEWMERVSPGAAKDVFAADSWVGAKAFFETLEAVPGPISREALVNQLRSIETYDAGGMLGPIRFGPKRTNGCFIGMQVQSGAWTRMAPAQGFLC